MWVTEMPEFNFETFAKVLRIAPDRNSIFEPEEHSEYLQKNVFDPLIKCGAFDINDVDFSQFELKHVTPNGCAEGYRYVTERWGHGFNKFIKSSPALVSAEGGFF